MTRKILAMFVLVCLACLNLSLCVEGVWLALMPQGIILLAVSACLYLVALVTVLKNVLAQYKKIELTTQAKLIPWFLSGAALVLQIVAFLVDTPELWALLVQILEA